MGPGSGALLKSLIFRIRIFSELALLSAQGYAQGSHEFCTRESLDCSLEDPQKTSSEGSSPPATR
jgi:hypothetical protein